ncbi:MAG: phosphoribosylglycinamide formyltransferase [Hyphomicrobiales bacterium]|nr:phosphoribosylglycinamide formyltransferase [Hyphomicrobiales bacterium]
MTKRRTAILISGSGSNMLALLEAARNPSYPARPCLVLSNNPEAAGLARAAALGVPVAAVDHRPFAKDRAAFEQALDAVLLAHGTEFIALAGFMRVLTGGFVGRWQGRMVNIHPSLLPLYRGLDTHARALAAGDTEHGCTVHWVVPELDAGEIIKQVRVPILPGDDAAMLAARVLAAEHALYPVALASAIRQAG